MTPTAKWLQLPALAALAGGAILIVVPAQAVAQTVLHACYVPATGTVYRIKTTDTKETCNGAKHVEFSWTDAVGADHGLLVGLPDDDHQQYLLADGVRNTTNGFAVTGTFGTGVIPASGEGIRLMWYPRKAAFRAGRALGSVWDDGNIGQFSVALGLQTQANGTAATALGNGTLASGIFSTALGFETTASGSQSTAMGAGAVASGPVSTGMGVSTTASGAASTAMGSSTTASGQSSTAMGVSTTAGGTGSMAAGEFTHAGGLAATALGSNTTASGVWSTAMGNSTTASGSQSTAMGTGTTASGTGATAMGLFTEASGAFSTALGAHASTNGHAHSFVFGDGSTILVSNFADNQFVVRASGGTIFYSNPTFTAGVSLAPGAGGWAAISDVNRKAGFRTVDGESVLVHIAAMPIQEWSYKAQDPSIRHLGPTAQDFYAAFGLGESDTTITSTDIDGINLLAIQALEQRTAELRAENQRLRAENAVLRTGLEALDARIAALEALRTPVATLQAQVQPGRRPSASPAARTAGSR